MTSVQRILTVALAIAVVAIVGIGVRLATSGDTASTSPELPTSAVPVAAEDDGNAAEASDPTESSDPAESSAAARAEVRERIRIEDGRPQDGPAKIVADVGDRVLIVVTSEDAEDDVDVHGYDIARPVAPGTPARIAFVASRPGIFDVELHTSSVKLADLEVR